MAQNISVNPCFTLSLRTCPDFTSGRGKGEVAKSSSGYPFGMNIKDLTTSDIRKK
jgi:hypothetical protein